MSIRFRASKGGELGLQPSQLQLFDNLQCGHEIRCTIRRYEDMNCRLAVRVRKNSVTSELSIVRRSDVPLHRPSPDIPRYGHLCGNTRTAS